jgi:uncharacterized protein YbjT (DUF2867 family)
MTEPLILLVGATGQVGSRVAAKLVARGARVRVLARNVDAATALLGLDVEIVRGDLMEPPSLTSALAGVDIAYLATAPGPQMTEQEINFIDAADAVDLPHLVKLSAAYPDPAPDAIPFRWHAAILGRIEKSGIPTTVLRPTMFNSLLRWGAPTVKTGKLHSVMGQSRFNITDPQDVADLAVAALTDPTHTGQTWYFGGPETVTYDQIADTLTRVLGYRVEHIGVDEATLRAGLRASGMPDWLGDVLVNSAELARTGWFVIDDTVTRRVLGRPGRDLAAWIDRNRDEFAPSG